MCAHDVVSFVIQVFFPPLILSLPRSVSPSPLFPPPPLPQKVVCYDPQYALRLCAERNLDEACVYIYAAMGLWEESVDLALKVVKVVAMVTCMTGHPLSNDALFDCGCSFLK